jgi:hypothetical protein
MSGSTEYLCPRCREDVSEVVEAEAVAQAQASVAEWGDVMRYHHALAHGLREVARRVERGHGTVADAAYLEQAAETLAGRGVEA